MRTKYPLPVRDKFSLRHCNLILRRSYETNDLCHTT